MNDRLMCVSHQSEHEHSQQKHSEGANLIAIAWDFGMSGVAFICV